ncbi:glycosyltransferase family 4 protein [Candidatus Woesearchaeota archaeon]|nr:glycosyltransferase family 4 protein [Candidatus Woesearchaeota archaeon]
MRGTIEKTGKIRKTGNSGGIGKTEKIGKIVYLCPYYGQIGGMQKVAQVIHERAGIDSMMITCDSKYPASKSCETKSKSVVNLRSFRMFSSPICPMLLPALFRHAKRNDILHVHVAQAFFPEMAWIYSKITKHLYIAHFHIDVKRSGFFGIMIGLYKKIILQKVLAGAARIIVPTAAYQRFLEDHYRIPKQKIIVIPNGTDISEFMPSQRRGKRFLFVGRLAHQKNIPLLLDAFKEFQMMREGYRLSLVGSGRLESELKEKARREGIQNVDFKGEMKGKELCDEYHDADYFILTSHAESFGIVCTEAMASGLPMVLVRLPELEEATKRNALFAEHDAKSIAAAMIRITDDRELCRGLVDNGLRIASQYDWSSILPEYEKEYGRLHQEFFEHPNQAR